MHYGMCFSIILGLLGLYLEELLICMLLCRRWCLLVSCDGMEECDIKSFEEHERMLMELKSLYFNTIIWTSVF